MSVRDKIAGFGGSGAAGLGGNRDAPAWAAQQGLHSAKPTVDAGGGAAFADFSKTSSGVSALGASKQSPAPVRRLKVPGVFQNTTRPADGPVHAVAHQSSFLPEKWEAGRTASAASRATSGRNTSGLGASMVETKSRSPPARPVTAPTSSSGTDSSNRKRDVLGLVSAPEASPSRPADGPEPSTADGGGGVKGRLTPMEGEPGRARGNARKQTGPRRLLVAGKGKQAISAEKQRAALGLDKDKGDDADNDDIPSKPGRTKQTPAREAARTASFASGHDTRGGNQQMPASYSTNMRMPVARVEDQARSGNRSGIPTTSSLRSSGHTLW